MRRFLFALLLLWARFADAFSFTSTTPTECDPLTVNWQGGTAPFYLLMTPAYGTPVNISIPVTAYDASKQSGSYTTTLAFAAGTKFLLTMSDATGTGSGGTSAVLQPGARTGPNTCNTTLATPDFFFDNNDALTQCIPYHFTRFPNAIQPVTITGLIPLGQSFVLRAPITPQNDTSYTWTVNVKAGTQLVVLMTDAQGRQGGASDVLTVGTSNDPGCLTGIVYSSTATAPPSTTSSGSPSSSSQPPSSPSHSSASSPLKGPIIGAAVGGGAVLLIVLIAFTLFMCRRRRQKKQLYAEHTPQPMMHRASLLGDYREAARGDYAPVPYVMQPSVVGSIHRGSPHQQYTYSEAGTSGAPETTYTPYEPYEPYGGAVSQQTSTSSKAGLLQQGRPPTVFVRHTDAGMNYPPEDTVPETEPEVVELPPEYPATAHQATQPPRAEKGAYRPGASSTSGAGGSDGGFYR